MVDGKPVVIDPQEMDEFFSDIMPEPRGRTFTPREEMLILEGYRRKVNQEDLAKKIGASPKTIRRWYRQYRREHPE